MYRAAAHPGVHAAPQFSPRTVSVPRARRTADTTPVLPASGPPRINTVSPRTIGHRRAAPLARVAASAAALRRTAAGSEPRRTHANNARPALPPPRPPAPDMMRASPYPCP
jgi:hypothetical protein